MNNESKDLIQELDNKLNSVKNNPFTTKAFELVKSKSSEYIIDLIDISNTNARMLNHDVIQTSDVEKASSYLISKRRGALKQICWTIGGLLLGGTMSNIIGHVSNQGSQLSTIGLITISVLLIIGTILITFSLVNIK